MARPIVYVTLSQFCKQDARPRRLLDEAGFEVRMNTCGRRLRPDELPALLREVDAVIAGVEPYDAPLLAVLPRLRCVSRCGIGTDAIDLAAAQRQGIRVYTTADEVVEPVAQLTVAMMLALARNLPFHAAESRASRWTKATGHLLSEWTIGLVGFGRIGRAVEHLLRPFAPRIVVADPCCNLRDLPEGVELRLLPALLAESDCVSLHASRRPDEGPLMGRTEFSQMKSGSVLVNTARGFLVDEVALLEALRKGGCLAGAALDVFEEEPYTGPLAQWPTVLCTPHIATLTADSRAAMERCSAQHVIEHFQRHSGVASSATAAGRTS